MADSSKLPFDISHLHKGDQNRIQQGAYTDEERAKLSQGENPWLANKSVVRGSADGGAGTHRSPTAKEESDAELLAFMPTQVRADYERGDEDQRRVLWEANKRTFEEAKERKEQRLLREQKRMEKVLDLLQRVREDPSKAHLLPPENASMANLLKWHEEMSKPVRTVPFPKSGHGADPKPMPMQLFGGSGHARPSRRLTASEQDAEELRALFPSSQPLTDDAEPSETNTRNRPWHKHRDLVVGILLASGAAIMTIALLLLPLDNKARVALLSIMFLLLSFSTALVMNYFDRLRIGIALGVVLSAIVVIAFGRYVWPTQSTTLKKSAPPITPPESTTEKAAPNITTVSYGSRFINFDPSTQTFVTADAGIPALVIEFRNAHERGKEISEAKDIRAHVYFEPFDFYKKLDKNIPGFAHVEEGIWLNEKSAVVNFERGEAKTLILAVQMELAGGFGGFDAFDHSISRRPDGTEVFLPRIPKLTADKYVVKVEITGGTKGEIAELYYFTMTLRPKFDVSFP